MKMTEYASGTPCWIDLGTSDLEGAKAFYGGLFGWDAHVADDPGAGGYTMFVKDGEEVAGLMGLMSPEQPTVWTSYVAVPDLDKTAEAVGLGGGGVIVPPMDVTDVGRMGLFTDPSGAAIGAWQPRAFKGAGLANEPGTFCWNELTTRDADGAKAFYPSVFSWGYRTYPFADTEYTEWQVEDRAVAGMMKMDQNFPPDLPPHWMVYFAVEDCEAAAAKITELGGTVSVPPTTIPVGRFAVCGDPQGAFFSIIQLAPDPSTG